MATYAYRQVDQDGVAYVNYNVTPDFSQNIFRGNSFTVTAQVRSNQINIKSVSVMMTFSIGILTLKEECGYTNKTISKGNAGTVTINCQVPRNAINQNVELLPCSISFYLFPSTGGFYGPSTSNNYTEEVNDQRYYVIRHRAAPIISGFLYADSHDVISGNQTPIEYFGNYIQSESLPVITAMFATDSRDPTITTTHRLVIKDSGNNVVYDVSGTAGASATTATLQLPAFQNAGTYAASWTITDCYQDATTTYTDSFAIVAYTPPSVSVLDLVRFASTPDGDIAADDGENLWLTLAGAVASVNSLNAYTVSLTYSHDGGTETTVAVTSDTDGGTISIAEDDTTPTEDTVLYGEVFDALYNYDVTLTVTDMFHTTQRTFIVLKAGGYMNVEKYGVAIGRRTHATPTDKRFEVANDYTSYFEGGIEGVTNYASGEVATGGKWIDGKPIYRYVYHNSDFNTTANTSTMTVHTVPSNMESIVNIYGTAIMNGVAYPLTYYQSDTNSQWCWVRNHSSASNPNTIAFRHTYTTARTYDLTVIVEYTKYTT